MAVFETVIRSDLSKPLTVQQLTGSMFSADGGSNKITVEVLDGGEPASLSGVVTGYAVRSDDATVVIEGTLSGNRASIVLPASCYVKVGTISIVVKVGTTTVGACTSYVYRTTTDTIVDPGETIPSLEELLEKIADCEAATAGANTAAGNANTAAGNANTAAGAANTAAGAANTAAGNANTAAGTANAAAQKINDMTVAANDLPAGSPVTVSITEVNGHKHIVFGLVHGAKGDKGDRGKDFHISKTFVSISAMMAYTGTDIEAYDFAMIDTGSVQDADTGKLYCYEPENNPKWRYIGDLSGAQGIKGETGTGIDHVSLNADYTLTVYYTNGTSDTTASIRGEKGEPGDPTVIASQDIEYQESESGTVIPTGTWSTTIPPVTQGHFLWTRITLTWDDAGDTQTVSYSVSRMGIDGSGSVSSAVMNGQIINPDGSGMLDLGNVIRQHQDISGKLNKNQGSANAGKFMKVGETGELTPDNVPAPSVMNGATDQQAGTAGLVPAPAAGDQGKFLKGNGIWDNVPNPQVMTGASARAAGASGLVPAPSAGDQDKVLKGDGTWGEAGLNPEDIANNLTTETAGKVLDARQGKVLKGLIDEKVSTAKGVTCDMTVTELMQLGGA